MCDVSLENFLLFSGITRKHPEIFLSGKETQINEFLGFFKKYTKLANEKKSNGLKVIDVIKKDFKLNDESYEQLQMLGWNEKYFKFCNSDADNEVYVYPKNVGGEKLTLPHKYFVNCIKLKNADPDSIVIVNRNKHMMLAANSRLGDAELSKEIHFKVLLVHNKKLKKWIVAPYKIVSQVEDKRQCYPFSMAASTDDVARQYDVWENGVKMMKTNLGVLNLKYYDEHFKSFPNLFSDEQNKFLLEEVHNIVDNLAENQSNKKSDAKSDKTSPYMEDESTSAKEPKKEKKEKKEKKASTKKEGKAPKKEKKEKKEKKASAKKKVPKKATKKVSKK